MRPESRAQACFFKSGEVGCFFGDVLFFVNAAMGCHSSALKIKDTFRLRNPAWPSSGEWLASHGFNSVELTR